MEDVINYLQNHQLLSVGLAALCFIGGLLCRRKVAGMRAAKYIAENQFDPVDPSVIEQGFQYYDGDNLNRYTILIRRLRTKLGHNGITIGHLAWVAHAISNSTIDPESEVLPDFKKK